MPQYSHVIDSFWRRHPALLYAIAIGFGTIISLGWSWSYALPIAWLLLPIYYWRNTSALAIRILLSVALALSVGWYVKSAYHLPSAGDNGTPAIAEFSIHSISLDNQYFEKVWIYRGCLKRCCRLSDNSIVAKNIPATIRFSGKGKNRPPANRSYIIQGTFKCMDSCFASFIPKKGARWKEVPHSFSLAEFRHGIKSAVKTYIQRYISDPRSAVFLCGIATGDFSDKLMLFEFSRFGLQHIMAISGFHFAIVAGMMSVILQFFLPRKKAALFLVVLLSSYFVFLGSSPSIMRAWVMILVVLAGFLLERQPISLNTLGVAVVAILAIDPLMVYRIGFQFSVLVTASILLNYSPIDRAMQYMLKRRSLSEVSKMSFATQHGYCLLTYFRRALSLAIAVNLAAIPLTLYHFGKYPLLGIGYNLFFPFMVSISILLLLLGVLTIWVPFLSQSIHALNSGYTAFVLNFAYNMPTSFDYFIRSHSVSLTTLIVYFTLLLAVSVAVRAYFEQEREVYRDLAFI